MSKKWMLLASVLSLGSAGTSQAHPLDSRDVVYIDGLPCNRACQSYMAWSRQTLSMSGRPVSGQFRQRSANAGVHRATALAGERLNPAAPARIATQAVPIPRERPQARVAALQPTDNAAARSNASPDTAGAAASSSTRTIKEQIAAATSLAEHVTAATAVPAPEPIHADGFLAKQHARSCCASHGWSGNQVDIRSNRQGYCNRWPTLRVQRHFAERDRGSRGC